MLPLSGTVFGHEAKTPLLFLWKGKITLILFNEPPHYHVVTHRLLVIGAPITNWHWLTMVLKRGESATHATKFWFRMDGKKR